MTSICDKHRQLTRVGQIGENGHGYLHSINLAVNGHCVLLQVLEPFLGQLACSIERNIEIVRKNRIHTENAHHKEVVLYTVKCKECEQKDAKE